MANDSTTHNPWSGDAALRVEFKLHPVETSIPGAYEDVEFVSIIVPGSNDDFFQPATDADRQRFHKQYAAFKAGATATGTPLSALGLSPAEIKGLDHNNILSVEALAHCPTGLSFPGFHRLQARARAYLDALAGEAPAKQMTAALTERDEKIAALQAQLDAFLAAQNGKRGASK